MEKTKNNLRYRLHYRLRKLGGRVDAKTHTVEVAYGEEIPPRARAVVERLVSLGYGVQWVIDGGGVKKGKVSKEFKVFNDINRLIIRIKRNGKEKSVYSGC